MQRVRQTRPMLAILLLVLVCSATASFAQLPNLDVDDQTTRPIGQTVVFTATISNAPTSVSAFGFELTFDANLLQFQSISPGMLLNGQNTDFLNANVVIAPGRLTVGGITIRRLPNGDNQVFTIASGATGSLLQLTFRILALPNASSALMLTNLVDDIAQTGWRPGSGRLLPDLNLPPVVNAGADQSITLPATATLTGMVTDDGLPIPPGTTTVT